MPKRLRPIGHEDRLSVVDHLDELRSRLIVCFAVLIVAFGFCFWQNHRLLDLLNRPLPAVSPNTSNKLNGVTDDSVSAGKHLERAGRALNSVANSSATP